MISKHYALKALSLSPLQNTLHLMPQRPQHAVAIATAACRCSPGVSLQYLFFVSGSLYALVLWQLVSIFLNSPLWAGCVSV